MSLSRRAFLAAASGAGLVGLRTLPSDGPLDGLQINPHTPWAGMLADADEASFEAEIEGRLPPDLVGTLWRTGPGRFSRGGRWKRTLLDGDGLLRRFRFDGHRVLHDRRFVRGARFEAEERAGRFLYPSVGTQAPGWIENLAGGDLAPQGAVSVLVEGDRVLALDDSGRPIAVRGRPLEAPMPIQAHSRSDGRERVHLGMSYGPETRLHLGGRRGDRWTWTRQILLDEAYLVHDFALSPRFVVLLLSPMIAWAWPFLAGRRSLLSCVEWWPQLGTRMLLVPRDPSAPPRWRELPAMGVVHLLDAEDDGDEVALTLPVWPDASPLLGPDLRLDVLAAGSGDGGPRSRLVRIRGEQVEDLGVADVELGSRTDGATHFVTERLSGPFYQSVLHLESGARHRFAGPVGEPLRAGGWLLVEGHDPGRNRAFLAVLRAERVADGPVAVAWLDRALPPGFHGSWVAA